ncbi:MAG TPA: hypothetical protein VL242_18025 [Sorangium sp.]|nr:hypothetical protein [Sorangium sp.]
MIRASGRAQPQATVTGLPASAMAVSALNSVILGPFIATPSFTTPGVNHLKFELYDPNDKLVDSLSTTKTSATATTQPFAVMGNNLTSGKVPQGCYLVRLIGKTEERALGAGPAVRRGRDAVGRSLDDRSLGLIATSVVGGVHRAPDDTAGRRARRGGQGAAPAISGAHTGPGNRMRTRTKRASASGEGRRSSFTTVTGRVLL